MMNDQKERSFFLSSFCIHHSSFRGGLPMRVRHRTPSIFSITMVDVLCCALGCMILMWINKSSELTASEKDFANVWALLNDSQSEEQRLRDLLAKIDTDKDTDRKKIKDLESKLA